MSTLPPPKMPNRPSDSFHIALLILCAVGFLVLYFKVDLDGSLNASYVANVSQQVERVERRMMMAEKKMMMQTGQGMKSEDALAPAVAFVRGGLLNEKGGEKLELQKKLVEPLMAYYNEDTKKIQSITIEVPSVKGSPYVINTVMHGENGYGVMSFEYGLRGSSLEYWKPSCEENCQFSEKFKAKYPQLVD